MRYGIISDIHSNLEGLSAVLDSLEGLGVDSILCCGDIIGYAAEPAACLELVRQKEILCIRGNHERGLEDLAAGEEPAMNYLALAALKHSEQQLQAEQKQHLLELPDFRQLDTDFLIFHGAPSHPDEYILDPFEAQYAFKSLRKDYPEPAHHICFIGHTHVCAIYLLERETQKLVHGEVSNPGHISLPEGHDIMVNVGSCGQYRGGLAQASFCVYDIDERLIEFRFVSYDVSLAQKKILAAGLPPELAERLAGGW
jgi:predicted phosphodiesterase